MSRVIDNLSKKTKSLVVKLPEETHEDLRRYAHLVGLPMGTAARLLIIIKLHEMREEPLTETATMLRIAELTKKGETDE